jgi:hypothetical protein
MKSYGTTWTILHKIRTALKERDDKYILKDVIELDGASFGKRHTGNQADALVAIETKDFIDDKGKPKSRAGFAKIMVAPEKRARKTRSLASLGSQIYLKCKGLDHRNSSRGGISVFSELLSRIYLSI